MAIELIYTNMYSIKMHQRRDFSSKQAAVHSEKQLGPPSTLSIQAIYSIQHALVTKWVQKHWNILQIKSPWVLSERSPIRVVHIKNVFNLSGLRFLVYTFCFKEKWAFDSFFFLLLFFKQNSRPNTVGHRCNLKMLPITNLLRTTSAGAEQTHQIYYYGHLCIIIENGGGSLMTAADIFSIIKPKTNVQKKNPKHKRIKKWCLSTRDKRAHCTRDT